MAALGARAPPTWQDGGGLKQRGMLHPLCSIPYESSPVSHGPLPMMTPQLCCHPGLPHTREVLPHSCDPPLIPSRQGVSRPCGHSVLQGTGAVAGRTGLRLLLGRLGCGVHDGGHDVQEAGAVALAVEGHGGRVMPTLQVAAWVTVIAGYAACLHHDGTGWHC